MAQWIDGFVLENRHWNDRLCSLRVKVDLPPFEAGQFVRVGLPEGDGVLARAYSLVNAPDEPVAEFYFNRVPDGPLSTRLHGLQEGDKVLVSNTVAGFLTLSELPECQHLWLLATGTALGPYLSILKTDKLWQKMDKVILVHGVRSADELTYCELIDHFSDRYPAQFLTLASVTRESRAGALRQRIPDAIRDGELERLLGMNIEPDKAHVMICGSPGLIEDAMSALTEKGLRKHRRRKPGHISVEIYK